jgi:hypothetical protein
VESSQPSTFSANDTVDNHISFATSSISGIKTHLGQITASLQLLSSQWQAVLPKEDGVEIRRLLATLQPRLTLLASALSKAETARRDLFDLSCTIEITEKDRSQAEELRKTTLAKAIETMAKTANQVMLESDLQSTRQTQALDASENELKRYVKVLRRDMLEWSNQATLNDAAETERCENEKARTSEEGQRCARERGRVGAETSRVTAEAQRVVQEQGRNQAETDRDQGEEERERGESSRMGAERARVDTAAERETKRRQQQVTLVSNERHRNAWAKTQMDDCAKIKSQYTTVHSNVWHHVNRSIDAGKQEVSELYNSTVKELETQYSQSLDQLDSTLHEKLQESIISTRPAQDKAMGEWLKGEDTQPRQYRASQWEELRLVRPGPIRGSM